MNLDRLKIKLTIIIIIISSSPVLFFAFVAYEKAVDVDPEASDISFGNYSSAECACSGQVPFRLRKRP